jgi:ABC-2 type transport system ATP-binding protein
VYGIHSQETVVSDQIIRVSGVHKAYGDLTVLDGVDLGVERGTVLALLGPNGAGKTTLVRILATLLPPDAGTATVAGHDVVGDGAKVRAVIGLTGQYAAVDELLTGEENLLMMARLSRLRHAEGRLRTAELLRRFDLVDAARRRVRTYSGGMRRRLDLAISMIGRPPVVVLDEPTTGLDPRSRRTLWAVIDELVAAGTTILLTTQYLEEAERLADRLVLIDHGRVVAGGTADELKSRLTGELVELTFADASDLACAVEVLGERTERPEPGRLVLSVPTDGSAAEVRDLLNEMDRFGVPVESIELTRPSLDDVFLELTEPLPAARLATRR